MKTIIHIINIILLTFIVKSNSIEIQLLKNQTSTESKNKNIPKRTGNNDSKNFKTNAFDNSQCGLLMQGPICINGGERVMLPSANPDNLVGHWTFDKIEPLDESGNFNHAKNKVDTGTTLGGTGYSAKFSQGKYLEVPNSTSFDGKDFAITFWFYLMKKGKEELGMKICPLLQKGLDDLFNKNYSRYPGIYLDRKEHKFKIYLKTNTPGLNLGESLFSNGRAIEEKWSHIAIIKKGNKLSFYLNGILDKSEELKGQGIQNKGSLFIGNSPPYKDQCKFNFMIDELKYYSDSIDIDFLQGEASPALGAIEPNFLQLGCMNCDIQQASDICNDGYRLCSSVELHAGGYMIAKSNGWITNETHIWTSSALKKKDQWKDVKGLGLCCAEIK